MAPVVVIQAVGVAWGKSARGGAAAAERNRAPEAVPLPEALTPRAGPVFAFHLERRVLTRDAEFYPYMGGVHPYVPEADGAVRVIPAEAPIHYGCITVHPPEDGAVRVEFQWSLGAGAPERAAYRPEALLLRPGQWGRVRYNGRHAIDYGWTYEKWVLNVGVFAESVAATVFLDSEPAQTYSQMADLR